MTSPTCPPLRVERPRALHPLPAATPIRAGEIDIDGPLACFSIDVEEYYHAEVFAGRLAPAQRIRLPHRAAASLERLGELLTRHNAHATLFVLADVVDALRPILRQFVARGDEIACHGCDHVRIGRLSPAALREDVGSARDRIQDALGAPVRGYRAPTFSITAQTWWALDVLADEGFDYDASVFPIRHDRYGVPDAPAAPFLAVTPSGRKMLEFPPLTAGLGPLRLPVGGGGYLRLLPARWVCAAYAHAAAKRRAAMLYVHPWELDPDQPRLPAGVLATWRHRVGMRRTTEKLGHILKRVRFDTAWSVLQRVTRTQRLAEFAPRPPTSPAAPPARNA